MKPRDGDGVTPDGVRADRHGLFRLYPGPLDTFDPIDFTADIVAIHGLGGHPVKTWRCPEDDHVWLRDSLPRRVPTARIMTFGYDSTVLFGGSRSTANDFALDLATRLRLERRDHLEKQRPLIFVCHSLGGVVFKEFLIHLSLQLDDGRDLLQSVFGVVFLGTPHRGSRRATPAKLLSKIINVATLGSGALRIVSFYEQKPIGPNLVVEPFSAILGLPNERAIPVNADHKKLAKLSPINKQRYKPVWTAIKELVEESSETLDKANERLLEQLFCVDYKSARLRPQLPQGRTCQWIFNDPTYISWLQSEKPSMILLTGSAGTGKSVMTRYVTESILSGNQTEGTGMDYLGISFFCSYNEALVSDEVTVLRSLLHQLIQINGHCASIVRSYLEKRKYHGMEISFKAADLWASLFGVLSMTTMQRVYIAIDAIEELGPYVATSLLTGLWKTMSALQCDYPESRLRIFVSSRFKPPPDAPGLSSLTMLSMNMSHIQTDITLFLRDAVDDLAYRSAGFKAALSPASQHQIVNSIAAKAEGRFLQAVLMWEDFRRGLIWNQNVIMQKLKRLGALGSGMVALYNKIIDAMDDVTRDDAFTIFSVLAAAAQPLSEIELGTIIGMNHSSKPIVKSSDIEPIRDLYQVMEENFPDLVSIQDDNRVIFVHHSFREYLDQREEFRDRLFSGHRKITRACLKYLKLADMLDSAKTNGSAYLDATYPFLSYARDNFLFHIRKMPYDDSLWLSFADTAGPLSVYTLPSLYCRRDESCSSPLLEVLARVPAPAKFELIREFREHGYDLDEMWAKQESGRAMSYCCRWAGSEPDTNEAALLLLRLGANPNPNPSPWESNLRLALEGKALDLYARLLRHPLTDHNAGDTQGRAFLHYLVRAGNIDRISQLLDASGDVDVNVQGHDGFTPLHLAVVLGHGDVVRTLLAVPGIRLDLEDTHGRTALTLATYWGMKRIALILIEHSQAFPLPGADQPSALVFSAQQGQKSLCLDLLARTQYRNLDFHIDKSGRGLLHHAAINNWDDVLAECFQAAPDGLNVNKIDHSGKTALHYAAALGNVEACLVLVDSGGASLTLQDRNGRTAPQAAADAGFKEALVILLQTGRVDPSQRDVEGRSIVHWAATIDCIDVMEMLADYERAQTPIEWARRDKYGKRPVDIAGICGCKYVGLFLAARTPGWQSELPDWDFRAMYRSASVEASGEESDGELPPLEDLEIRHSRRQNRAARREWKETHQRFPDSRYGLVPYDHRHAPNPFSLDR
ncbi:ankyrin repeats (3 copies) domain-containing protein [Purpureocillium lilacinum]|uniref:Ankyrin repeats (3 copies) domain-containing protein n=1 Tax=Purpureocillium lilacinum TaxID=33203 RepID=A0A179GDP2_PURLI|nr:ankyrin repeats (3 copies) domain-containing protein [Purpureocillium lilacinum]